MNYCIKGVSMVDDNASTFRLPLSVQISKFMYNSSRNVWEGHYTDLIRHLHISQEIPEKDVQIHLKEAVGTLIEAGIAKNTSGFTDDENLVIEFLDTV
jgi:hypothetical protein